MADGRVVFDIVADAAQFDRTVSRLERSVHGVVRSVGSTMASAGDALTLAVTTPLTAGVAAASRWAAGVVGAAEQADIALSTMLGPERARAMLEELAEFARKTPFEMGGLTSATQKLLAYGFAAEDVIPLLTSVGDASAALGAGQEGIDSITRAMGQMQAKGKVMSEEMLQLTEVGVPAWQYLADVVSGGDVPAAMEMVTAGAVDADTAIAALRDGMEGDFGGMMAEQATTLQGVLSNLSDAVESQLRKLKDTDGWADMTEALSRLSDAAGPLVESALPLLDDLLSDVAAVVGDVAGALDGLDTGDLEALAKGAVALAAAGPGMSVAGRAIEKVDRASEAAGDVVAKLSEGLLNLATSPKTASTTLGRLAGVVTQFPGPAALAAGGIALLGTGIADFVRWSTEGERQARVQAEALEVLGSASEVADGSMEGAARGAEELGHGVHELSQGVQENWQDIADLGEAFDEIDARANAQIGSLSRARGAIADYAGEAGLTSQEQGALRAAVEAVNAACGTNYEVVRDSDGAYQVMQDGVAATKDELYELIDAQVAQAKVSAQTEKLESLYKAQADQASDYAEAVDKVREAREFLADQEAKYGKGNASWAKNGLEEAEAAAAELQVQMEETGSAIETTEQGLANIQGAAQGAVEGFDALVLGSAGLNELFGGSQDAMADFADALEASGVSLEEYSQMSDAELMEIAAAWDGSSEGVRSAIQATGAELGEFTGILSEVSPEMQASAGALASAMGLSLGQLESQLAGMGVTAEQVSGISQQQFDAMAVACGGDISTLAWMIQNYNQTPILDKDGSVTADTSSLVDAQGQVYTWNGTQLVDKQGSAVVYMSDLTEAQRAKVEWNESGVATLDGRAVVDDSELVDAQGNKVEWNGSELVPKETWADVDTSGLESGISLLTTWNNMRAESKTASFVTTNRTVNVVETQVVQRSAPARPAPSARAARAAATEGDAAQPLAAPAAPAEASPMAASLMSVPLPAAAEAIMAAVASSVMSPRRGRGGGAPATESAAERVDRLENAISSSADRIEEAVLTPVTVMWDMRELGRLVKEAESA